jgi:cytochrome c551/c552
MSKSLRAFIGLLFGLLVAFGAPAQEKFPGVGRTATTDEIRAWDIDVRADFKGLPKGSGSVRKGEEVWEAKCASCHGTFGESNSVFFPIAGGTSSKDVETGRVAALLKPEQARTMMMKLSQLSTLWDYINRAMPWNAPKSLTVEEVYATVAYILSLAYVVPEEFVLSDANIAEVQKRLPNRNGMNRAHGLWDLRAKPDIKSTPCMNNCSGEVKIVSSLPDYARAAHGNLADQMRSLGPTRGVATLSGTQPPSMRTLAESSGCLACHGLSAKVIGPGLNEIAAKYKQDAEAESRLSERVKKGGQGSWGSVAMPPHAHLKDDDIRALVKWILGGAG